MDGAGESFDSVAGLEVCDVTQLLNNLHHGFPIEHACDIVGDGGGDLSQSRCRNLGQKRRSYSPPEIGKGVSVEEEKWGGAMAAPQEFNGLAERPLYSGFLEPVCFERLRSF